MQIGQRPPTGAHHRVGGPAGHDDHPEIRRPARLGRLRHPAFEMQPVRRQRVHDARDVPLVVIPPHPEGVVERAVRTGLHGRGRPDPAAARRLHREDTRRRRTVRGLDEQPGHPVLAHQLPYVVPAPHARAERTRGRGLRDGHTGRVQHGVTRPLVEQHRQVVRVGEGDTAAQRAQRGGEPRVPAGRALHPGRLRGTPQQPVDLGVLTRGVDPDELVGGEVRAPRAQDVRPGDDTGRGQPGRPHGVREEGHPAVLGIADHREPEAGAGRRRDGDRPGRGGRGHSPTAT